MTYKPLWDTMDELEGKKKGSSFKELQKEIKLQSTDKKYDYKIDQDDYSYEKVMARLRKNMGEKRWKSKKGRAGQSLMPSGF